MNASLLIAIFIVLESFTFYSSRQNRKKSNVETTNENMFKYRFHGMLVIVQKYSY